MAIQSGADQELIARAAIEETALPRMTDESSTANGAPNLFF